MGKHENLSGAQRAARYRAAKHAQGLRLKQMWVPDLSDPALRAKISREISAISASREESDYTRWLGENFDELMAGEPSADRDGQTQT